MAIRIKSKWSKTSSKTKTSEDIASALSFIAWKLSLDKARNLHGEDFEYENDVVEEKAKFQILKRDYERAEELFTQGSISEQFRDNALLEKIQQEIVLAEAEKDSAKETKTKERGKGQGTGQEQGQCDGKRRRELANPGGSLHVGQGPYESTTCMLPADLECFCPPKLHLQ